MKLMIKDSILYNILFSLYFADIDDCATKPCLNNGTCIDGIAAFTCQCAEGFTGRICDIGQLVILYNLSKQTHNIESFFTLNTI